MKHFLLPTIAALSLAGCTEAGPRKGVGFTGIDGEPRTLSTRDTDANFGRSLSVPVAFAELPTRQVISDAPDQGAQALVAIDNGGRLVGNAVEVGGSDRVLMLSSVAVNGSLFAVLRAPENSVFKITSATTASFGAAVPRLTGCLTAGNVYQKGKSSRRTQGLAVPLNCR
ncbi:hypothetical protein [Ruegeria hyattellae]|uniref:hypothetical protein n=1 Tax=Ruegeria hyattellae TaxID=3233337 RepID=UPI00355C3673